MHNIVSRRCGVLALVLLMAGCGGGSDAPNAPPVSVTPPPPAPTPPPTSTAAPSANYASAFDFSTNRSFESPLAEVRTYERYEASSPTFYVYEKSEAVLNLDPRAARFDYLVQPQTLTATIGAETTFFNQPSTLSGSPGVILTYGQNVDGEVQSFHYVRPREDYRYVSGNRMLLSRSSHLSGPVIRWDTERYFLLGTPTLVTDVPTSGAFGYSARLSSSPAAYRGLGGFDATSTLTFDAATSRLTGTMLAAPVSWVTGTTPTKATLIFSGNETDGVMKGTISSPDSGYSGEFVGRLYGPAGAEMGIIFTLVADNWNVAGQTTARKN